MVTCSRPHPVCSLLADASVATLLVLAACGDERPTESIDDTGTVIDAAGGTVISDDGQASVFVPPGAVGAPTTFSITPLVSDAPGAVPGTGYALAPEGSVFDLPVLLRIAYDPGDVPTGIAESDLRIHRRHAATWIEVTGGTVDTLAHEASAPLTSFSDYGVMPSRGPTPTDSLVVYVVDAPPPGSTDEFTTLTEAVSYVEHAAAAGERGVVVIRTSTPQQVDQLAFTVDIAIRVDPEHTGVIQGPGSSPLIVDAAGAATLQHLQIVNSAGLVINANRHLRLFGNTLPGQSTVNVGGVKKAAFPAAGAAACAGRPQALAAGGEIVANSLGQSFALEYTSGSGISGAWTVADNAGGAVQVGGAASLGLDYHLDVVNNQLGLLNVDLDLEANAGIRLAGNSDLSTCGVDLRTSGTHALEFDNNAAASLTTRLQGIGTVSFVLRSNNITSGNFEFDVGDLQFEDQIAQYGNLAFALLSAATGNPNYALDLASSTIAGDLTVTAVDSESGRLTLGLDQITIEGDVAMSAKYQGEYDLDGVTVVGDATVTLHSNLADVSQTRVTYQGALYVSGQGAGMGLNFSSNLDSYHGATIVTVPTAASLFVRLDGSAFERGGMFYAAKQGGLKLAGRDARMLPEEGVTITGLDWKGSGLDRVELATIDGPVHISGCTFQQSSGTPLYVLRCHGAISISGNTFSGGGMKLVECDGPATIANNTINAYNPDGPPIWLATHGTTTVSGNTIMCSGAATGIHVFEGSGMATLTRNSIQASGADFALHVANSEVHATENVPVAGNIAVASLGRLLLSGNALADASVVDSNTEGGLLVDPVESNDGLSPDKCRTYVDWDGNGCCDYPPESNVYDPLEGCVCEGVPPPGK